MRPGDLVQFKVRGVVFELGGHRNLDQKRYWWISPKYQEMNLDEVYVVIENNPKLYGPEADRLKEERLAILIDSSTRKFLIASHRQIRTVNSVLRSKE